VDKVGRPQQKQALLWQVWWGTASRADRAALHDPPTHPPLTPAVPRAGLLCTYFIPETTGMSLESINEEDVPRHVKGDGLNPKAAAAMSVAEV
jgi:hypothetical protein